MAGKPSATIRREFIDFFIGKQHTEVASAPVVPPDDPTLMFTNAGMNQFKDVFLGTGSRPYTRAVDTQKCIRAGGKHNDLDDVGHDTYHHTFFEMLGNWSFGDYFKHEAIAWAWELLTGVWRIDKSRLHATYFEGEPGQGVEADTEARELWASVTDIDPSHIHPGGAKDNFWEMGDTGPCGPCSEIHIDLTPDKSGGHLVNAGDARVIEIWNLVFIQYNRASGGKLTPLPAKHVDTGMGFERIASVLQGMETGRLGQLSNYDTDVFAPFFAGIRDVTGAPGYTGLLETSPEAAGAAQPLPHGRGSDMGRGSDQSRARKEAVPGAGAEGAPLAYFITYHTYGTWLHGTPEGSVDSTHNVYGEPVLDPDSQREREEFVRMKHEPVELDDRRRDVVSRTIREVCQRRGWDLHELNVRTNHVHVVVSGDVKPEKMLIDFKSYSTRRMVEAGVFPPETKAWTRHGSTRYLWKPESLAEACMYVREGQGIDLVGGVLDQPLPDSRGSDLGGGSDLDRGSDQSRDRKGADDADQSHDRESMSPEDKHTRVDHAAVMRDIAYRVVADHVRCLTFAITDGASPSNEGRGYVLRRILRRAVRYGRQYLGTQEPFLHKLVPVVVEMMGEAFPELRENTDRVAEIIRDEEESFGKTLDRGIALFELATQRAVEEFEKSAEGTPLAQEILQYVHPPGSKAIWPSQIDWRDFPVEERPVISGEDAFKLHDTYGFPIDLTQVMAKEKGLHVDTIEYERLMEEARELARGPKRDLDDAFEEETYRKLSSGIPTDDSLKYIEPFECRAFITGMARHSKLFDKDSVEKGQSIIFNTNRTPFYSEQGGQVSDTGVLETDDGALVDVVDVARRGEHILHHGVVRHGEVSAGEVRLCVNQPRRKMIMKNHTATHILNWSLREVLEFGGRGKVDQKGSLVDPDKTRFDFSHNKPLTPEEIERIESLCNEHIRADRPVYTKEVPEQEARQINTLRAVFGEKYPEMVRVVSAGADIDTMLGDPQNPEWMKYPVEFCGGTHVKHTGEIGAFVLTAEESVAKGIRRVVGITGEKAERAIETGRELLAKAAELHTNAESAVASDSRQSRDRKGAVPAAEEPLPYGRGSDSHGRGSDSHGRGTDLSGGLAELQKQMADAEIPLLDRFRLRETMAELQRIVKQQSKQQVAASAGAIKDIRRKLLDDAERVNGTAIVVGELPEVPVAQVREAADWLRTEAGSAAVCLGLVSEGKPMLVAAMTDDVVKKGLRAGDLIKAVVPAIDGRGGGKPNLAQAGGNNPDGIPDALKSAAEWIRQQLG